MTISQQGSVNEQSNISTETIPGHIARVAGVENQILARAASILATQANDTLTSVQLDATDYGEPPKDSNIVVNPELADYSTPQAWEDKNGNWLYNFPAVMIIIGKYGRKLPTIEQLISSINSNPEKYRTNAGIRLAVNFSEQGQFSGYWSSTQSIQDYNMLYADLPDGVNVAEPIHASPSHGLSLRFIKK